MVPQYFILGFFVCFVFGSLGFFFSTSVKKCHWNFDRDCVESGDGFGSSGHFSSVNSVSSLA